MADRMPDIAIVLLVGGLLVGGAGGGKVGGVMILSGFAVLAGFLSWLHTS